MDSKAYRLSVLLKRRDRSVAWAEHRAPSNTEFMRLNSASKTLPGVSNQCCKFN